MIVENNNNTNKKNKKAPGSEIKRRMEQSIRDKLRNGQLKIGNNLESTGFNPVDNRDVDLMYQARKLKLVEYIFGSLHPKYAVENNLEVKLPTDLPIPTYTIRTSRSVQIATPASGTLFVNYLPGSLLGTNINQGTISPITVNTTCNGNGTAGTNAFVDVGFSNIIQAHERWRLVASEARLSYNGAVLNQAGIMYSAVHYEPASVAVKGSSGTGAVTNISNGDIDKFSSNFQLVKQSLWNKTVNLTSHGEGVSHLWTPTQSYDYTFPGYSQGSSTNFTYCVGPLGFNNTNTIAASKVSQGTGSAVRQFMWACTNLPPSSTCLILDIYEIYEAIPESEAINILQVRTSDLDLEDQKSGQRNFHVYGNVKYLRC